MAFSNSSKRPRLLPPLSPLTYYRRNWARTLPVGGAVAISVFLIAGVVTLLNSIDDSIQHNFAFLRQFSVLASQLESDASPELLAHVGRNPKLKGSIDTVAFVHTVKILISELPVPIYGVAQGDMPRLVALTGNKVVEGRLPQPGEAEVTISRLWATNMGLKLGATMQSDKEKVPTLSEPREVVGILEGGSNIALADIDFVVGAFPNPAMIRHGHMLIPKSPALLPALNRDINNAIKNPKSVGLAPEKVRYAKFFTQEDMVRQVRDGLGYFYNFVAIADAFVICTVALLSGFLANIYFEGRLGEFGLLAAFGIRRERLALRLVVETGGMIIVSWLAGLGLTVFALHWLDVAYMAPRGLLLSPLGWGAVLYSLPTPLLVGLASLATVLLRLYRLDPIEIMERR